MQSRSSQEPTYPGLPLPATPHAPGPARARVCIASYDLVGPIRNGGIGTAFTSLAELLAGAGHEVTLLYLGGAYCEIQTIEHWIREYEKKGIRFVPLPEQLNYPVIACWHQAKSFETYLWLRQQTFDVVHFADWRGAGYYSILAKHQGLAFSETILCIGTHGPTLWSKLNNGEYLTQPEDLEIDFMERETVRLADAVVSPSRYLFGWMLEEGWVLSPGACVQQNITPASARAGQAAPPAGPQPVRELVFFGRLEVRKGLVLFCDALDRLQIDSALGGLQVTFLGKPGEVSGLPSLTYLENRAQSWPWKWRALTDCDQPGAMAYLKGPGRLAVIPSLVDNLPYTVLECLCAGIPLLCSHVGGIPEMVAPEDLESTCFPLDARALAQKLKHAALAGATPARMAVPPSANDQAWLAWHAAQAKAPGLPPLTVSLEMPGEQPLVSVCLAHFNRPQLLRQALTSIEAQDYSPLEVVLVDDASHDPAALAYLEELAPVFAQRRWQLVRNAEELFVGAARNLAARQARGEYLLFMDDDNCAKPHEVSTFVKVARTTGAGIVTCFLDFFSGHHAPAPEERPIHRVLFLGAAAAGGALHNTFGDTNALIRRELFLKLGGFHEHRGVGHEDWQLYAEAVLKGHRLEVVPDALVWYRRNESERCATRTNSLHAGHMQNIQPYLDAVPPLLRNLILFVQGQSLELEKGQGQTSQALAQSQFTIKWRSLYEAGRVLARLSQPDEAVGLLLDALKAAESSRHPLIVLDALLHAGKELIPLDSGRSRQSLQLAAQLAQNLKNEAAFKQAQFLLNELSQGVRTQNGGAPSPSQAPSVSPASPAGSEPCSARPATPAERPTETSNLERIPSDSSRAQPDLLAEVAEHLNARRDREALDLANQVLCLQPRWLQLHFGRAVALARLGRRDEARDALLKLSPPDRASGKARLLWKELDTAR
jgi:GT2 family glycosyltransferase/glycosyltransferase involved in cell wall biosynthesis